MTQTVGGHTCIVLYLAGRLQLGRRLGLPVASGPPRSERLIRRGVGWALSGAIGTRIGQADTTADELMLTTLVYDHTDRLRSYELVATALAANSAVRPRAEQTQSGRDA